jgi:hypothetical protein
MQIQGIILTRGFAYGCCFPGSGLACAFQL